jgi:hypothetical protein
MSATSELVIPVKTITYLVIGICVVGVLFYFLTSNSFNASSFTSTTSSTTTTTVMQTTTTTIIMDLNFSNPDLTPSPRTIIKAVINNHYNVYLNDSFLILLDPNRTNGFYVNNTNAIKNAFKIWEEETSGTVSFDFLGTPEKNDIYVEWSSFMESSKFIESTYTGQHWGETYQLGYNCTDFWFNTGGVIKLNPQRDELEDTGIALHEIGHILNLNDVGNYNVLMSTWYEENRYTDEQSLIRLFTDDIKQTIKIITRPDYFSACKLVE